MFRFLAFALISALCVAETKPRDANKELDEQLIHAAQNDDLSAMSLALEHGAKVNAAQEDGATALAWTVLRNNPQTAALLLDRKADPNLANLYGITPLSIAAQSNSAALAELLLNHGTDPNLSRTDGESPLMTAAHLGSVDVMKLLLDRHADPNACEKQFGQTALMWAVGHADAVRLLLDRHAAPRTISKIFEVKTVMYGAVRSTLGRTGIPWDTDGDYMAKKGGYNALTFAAELNDLESAKLLLAAGIDVNSAAADGATPLLRALYKFDSAGKSLSADIALARYLLQHGARADVADQVGYTPLHAAVIAASLPANRRPVEGTAMRRRLTAEQRADAVALVKELLDAGADPNRPTKYTTTGVIGEVRINAAPRGSSPVHLAADSGDPALLKLLLDHKGDAYAKRYDGSTPFLVAVEANDVAAVKECVAHGVDPRALDANGESVMHIAAGNQANRVIEYLFNQGLPLDAKDKAGKTPLVIAQETEELNAARAKENGRPAPPLTANSTSAFIKRLLSGPKASN